MAAGKHRSLVATLTNLRLGCDECLTEDGMVDRIDVDVDLTGPLTDEQHAELMRVAAPCPIPPARLLTKLTFASAQFYSNV